MDNPPAHTHNMNSDLDLPPVLNPTEHYSSPLSLSAGPSFYSNRGNLYQKNSGTQRKYHEQTRVNQLLEFRVMSQVLDHLFIAIVATFIKRTQEHKESTMNKLG